MPSSAREIPARGTRAFDSKRPKLLSVAAKPREGTARRYQFGLIAAAPFETMKSLALRSDLGG